MQPSEEGVRASAAYIVLLIRDRVPPDERDEALTHLAVLLDHDVVESTTRGPPGVERLLLGRDPAPFGPGTSASPYVPSFRVRTHDHAPGDPCHTGCPLYVHPSTTFVPCGHQEASGLMAALGSTPERDGPYDAQRQE